MEMYQIEKLTYDYTRARDVLLERAEDMQSEIDAIKAQKRRGLLAAIEKVNAAHAALKVGLEASPGLFKKPKTVIFYGVRVGYMKGKGATEIPDAEQTIAKIKAKYPDKVAALIETSEHLVRSALALMSAAELKKIGVEITDASDKVVIKSAEGDIDKLTKALLSEIGDGDA